MNSWKTVLAFTYPHEAHLARVNLESEGIEVMIKDELTAQVNNFYSNAIGGVKLQVREKDLERAYQILKSLRYVNEIEAKQNRLLKAIDKVTLKIPLLKKLDATVRTLVFTAVVLIGLIIPFALPSYPTTEELLVKNGWCVDHFFYEGVEYEYVGGGGMQIIIINCSERIRFEKIGMVNLPGNQHGNWRERKGGVIIYNAKDSMYNGDYEVKFEGDYLILESEKTTITAWANVWR